MGDRCCFSRDMKNEYCRRRSFSDLEDTANLSLSPGQLAKEGFYYVHETGKIQCYFCGFVISDRSSRVMPRHCENSNYDIPQLHGDYLMVPSGQPIDHQDRSRSPHLPHHSGHWQSRFPELPHHSGHWQSHSPELPHLRGHWQSRSPELRHHGGHWQTPAGDRSSQTQVNHASPSACDRTRLSEVTHASPSVCDRTRPSEVTHASPSVCDRTRPSEVIRASPFDCFRTRQANVNHARPSDTAFTCQHGFSKFVRLHTLKKGQAQILEKESVEVEGCAQSEESSETLATVSNQGVRGSRILMPRNLESSQDSSPCSLTTGANELSNMARPPSEVMAPDLPNHIQLSKRVKNCSEGPQMYRDRKTTLESMPFSLPFSPDILAAAGFYYEVDCKRVMCFSCGGYLQTSASDTRTTDAGHSPVCKYVSSPQQTLEPSSQPASLTDTEIASLPMVQEIAEISFDVPDIVNACRELNSTLDIRDITRDEVLMYMFENQGREDIHDNSEPCLCCVCCRASICIMCFPCRHGCCHDCKLRLLNRCPRCDEVIKATINVYVS